MEKFIKTFFKSLKNLKQNKLGNDEKYKELKKQM